MTPTDTANTVTPDSLDQPPPNLARSSRNANFATMKRPDIIDLLNRTFGPSGWTNGYTDPKIIADELAQNDKGETRRCVSFTSTAWIEAKTSDGTIRHEGLGAHHVVDTPGPGFIVKIRDGAKGCATNALKDAASHFGRYFGSQLSSSRLSDLQAPAQAASSRNPKVIADASTTARSLVAKLTDSDHVRGVFRLFRFVAIATGSTPDARTRLADLERAAAERCSGLQPGSDSASASTAATPTPAPAMPDQPDIPDPLGTELTTFRELMAETPSPARVAELEQQARSTAARALIANPGTYDADVVQEALGHITEFANHHAKELDTTRKAA